MNKPTLNEINMKRAISLLIIMLFLVYNLCIGQTQEEQNSRVIILTDVENEPDDT